MTLNEYSALLARHDWTYQYSDDYLVWSRGADEREKIIRAAKESPAHQALFDAAAARYTDYPNPVNASGQSLYAPVTQCAWCERVKVGEQWIRRDAGNHITHGICPDCYDAAIGDFDDEIIN